MASNSLLVNSSPIALSSYLRHPTMVTAAVSQSGCLELAPLPEYRGLKIQTPLNLSLVSTSKRNPWFSRRSRGRIVCEVQETALDIPTVTDATWQSLILNADGPVLVEFWASWCGPCRVIHPVVAELSTQYAGKLKCFKLNADESPSIATTYGIRSIPTIMIFNKGEKKDAVIGAVPKTTLTATIEKFL